MSEITREQEIAAFEKLRDKLDRVHPSTRESDPELMPKMKWSEWAAIVQFYKRHN